MKTLKIFNHQLVDGKIPQDLLNLLTDDITELDLSSCDSLTSLPENLPTNLTELNLSDCDSLTSLPEKLPTSLTKLDLTGCDSLTSLPENLPTNLTELDLSSCNSLTSLPEKLPTNLTKLDLTGCYSLTSLPEELPSSLTDLNLVGCSITSLPELPTNLTKLNLRFCRCLTSLPELPTNLTKLDLTSCYSLTSLPEELPSSLTEIDLRGCENLKYTPELMARLNALNNAGCSVEYPQHFARDATKAAKDTLDEAITKYKESNTNVAAPSHIKKLLGRYLTDDVTIRYPDEGKFFKEIAESVMPILKVFTENPNHLEWAEKVAKHYLAGCVNQPVAGWSEISASASMAMQEKTINKIKASAHLRVLDIVKAYVAELPKNQKPGQAVEAEAGNALFREVYNKLLSNNKIEKPWPAVPQKIVYESTIETWLTADKITFAYNLAVKELEKPLGDVAKDLLEKEHWGKIAFPNAVKEIEESYKVPKTNLMNDLDQNPHLAVELYNQHQKLESDQQTKIYEEVKKLTDQAINPPTSTRLKREATTQLGDDVQKKVKGNSLN